ncbi:MAG TPA: DNA-directed DNA polymerase [archaeon]|nr:DNA-directed DNA polymerase [archaeon]
MADNKLYGILLDCTYKFDEKANAIIQLFFSTANSIEVFEDRSFKPYFYLISKSPKDTISALHSHDFGEGVKVLTCSEIEVENAKNVIKVEFKNPQELVKARESIESIEGVLEKREYDIPFTTRYLIDKKLRPMDGVEVEYENGQIKNIKSSIVSHELRIASLDLETYSPGRFSDPKKDPILMAVLCTNKWTKVYTYKKTDAKSAVVLKDEKEVVEKMLADLREFKPDILVTYNGDSFDLPYVKERCERLKVNCDFGFGGVRLSRNGLFSAAEIKGTQHLDAFTLVKFMTRIGAISLIKFDIENVSEKLFGKPKAKVAAAKINELWDRGEIDSVVDYNREDGEVTLQLAKEFLPLQIQLCAMLHDTLHEVSRSTSSQMVEQLLLVKSHELGRISPNKPTESEVNTRTLQTYEGGFVKAPLPGLHENIAVLDFRSLHPTIMIAHNISPETLRCEHEECKRGKNVSLDKDWFCEKRVGFLSGILEEILKDRTELKHRAKKMDKADPEYKMLNARQHALKILLNSHYGYLGYPRSRWYSRECARAVTAWSRHYIQTVMGKAEEQGFKVVYGDTDSLFLLMPKNRSEKEVHEFMQNVNSQLPSTMELELDGIYMRGIFVTKREGGAAKKKYALIDAKGNLKIVGFEYVRRDWAIIAKETQKGVIEAILKEGDTAKAIAITKEVIKKLKAGTVPKKELVIMKQLKRAPAKYDSPGPQVAAAKKAMARGKDIDVGSIIAFVVTKGSAKSKSISERAELEEYVKEGDYDSNYYIEHQILPAVALIMHELGYSKEDLIHGGKQSTLFGSK